MILVSFDRRAIRYCDWVSVGIMLILSCVGLILVYSATCQSAAGEIVYSSFFKKQCWGVLSGLCIYVLMMSSDVTFLQRIGYFIYFAVILLLIFTSITGTIGLGARRWIDIGIVKFQPSELAKLFVPAFMTYYFMTEPQWPTSRFLVYFTPFILLCVSVLLILKQPDLGTAILVGSVGILMLWLVGVPQRFFILCAVGAAVTAPLLWQGLKPYQRQRILVFLGGGDARKERYQIEQSQIAVGSGGIWGKGFLRGTQNKLLFLPESRTDFIFAVLCEEWGLIGAFFVIILYSLLAIRLLMRMRMITDFFSKLLAVGLLLPTLGSIIINMGMVLGMLPIVGIPLPFLSYGITHLWISYASIGWAHNIIIYRTPRDRATFTTHDEVL